MTHPHSLSLRSKQYSTQTALRASLRTPMMKATRMMVPKKMTRPKWSSSVSLGFIFFLQQSIPTIVGNPTARMTPPIMIRLLMTDTAEQRPRVSKMIQVAVLAEAQQFCPVTAITGMAMLFSVLRQYSICLRIHLTMHCTHRRKPFYDSFPSEFTNNCMTRTIASSRAAKVSDPRWFLLILPRAVQKQPSSLPQYHREQAVEMKKLRTQYRKIVMKMQTKRKYAAMPVYPLVLSLASTFLFARICTATKLTAQKTKNKQDRKKTQRPARYTEGLSPINLLAMSINLIPISISFLQQKTKRAITIMMTAIEMMSPTLLLQIAITKIASMMAKTATTIVQITHRRQNRMKMRQSTAITMERMNIPAISPGNLEKTTASILLARVSLGWLIALPSADDWSAITKMPRMMNTSIIRMKNTQQQGSFIDLSSAGPPLMLSASSLNSTFSCQYTGSILDYNLKKGL